MSKNNSLYRKSIRNRTHGNALNKKLFLYGKLLDISKAIGYCELHKCYLDLKDVKEKKCIKKKCKYMKEV